MTRERNSVYVIVILIALVGVVFSCVCGMFGGFMAGAWQARKIAGRWTDFRSERRPQIVVPDEDRPSRPPELVPTPERERLPSEAPLPDDFLETFLNAGYPDGALLLEINPDSPAEAARLRPGDIIVAVDETEMSPDQDSGRENLSK